MLYFFEEKYCNLSISRLTVGYFCNLLFGLESGGNVTSVWFETSSNPSLWLRNKILRLCLSSGYDRYSNGVEHEQTDPY